MRTSVSIAAALATLSFLAMPAAGHDMGKGRSGDRDGSPIHMFELFDGNGDDSVTMDEIEAAWAERFSDADSDGDGQLSAEELANAIEEWRVERRNRHIRNRIERHDANDDGLLSLEEAIAAVMPERFERMFERLDADSDGMITKSELEDGNNGRRSWFRRGHGH